MSANPCAVRFDERDDLYRDTARTSLVSFLQRDVEPEQPLLGIGCGRGEVLGDGRATERAGAAIRLVCA